MQPDVAPDLRADYLLGLDLQIGGWPIQFVSGAVAGVGGTLSAKSLPAPLHVGALRATVSRGGIDFAPTEISFAPSQLGVEPESAKTGSEHRNSFVLRGALSPSGNGKFRSPLDWNFSVEGATPRVQDWFALSAAFAQPVNSDWTATGGLALKMRGVHRAESSAVPWLGSMDFLGLTLSPAYVNQPLQFPKAHVEFAPLQQTITLSAAEGFGAAWRGSISRKYSDKQWTFDLAADHLDTVELDRWLGPRARPGFLARLTGSNSVAAAASLPANAVVTRLAAHGRLRAGVIDLPPMQIENFDGEAELAGRTIKIRKGQADFFGGKISGSFDAQLLPDPSYEFQGRFDRVDLDRLGTAVPFLSSRMAGNASATLSLPLMALAARI